MIPWEYVCAGTVALFVFAWWVLRMIGTSLVQDDVERAREEEKLRMAKLREARRAPKSGVVR